MLRVTTVFVGAVGAPYYNQLYFGSATTADAQAAATAARQFWGNASNAMSTLISGTINPEVELVDPSTGQVTDVLNTVTTGISGSATGEPLPPANQGLIRLLTGTFVNGRRLRGRVFVPGPTETQASSGVPGSSYLDFCQDAIDALLTSGADAGGAQIYSPTHRVAANITSGNTWAGGYAVLRSRRD